MKKNRFITMGVCAALLANIVTPPAITLAQTVTEGAQAKTEKVAEDLPPAGNFLPQEETPVENVETEKPEVPVEEEQNEVPVEDNQPETEKPKEDVTTENTEPEKTEEKTAETADDKTVDKTDTTKADPAVDAARTNLNNAIAAADARIATPATKIAETVNPLVIALPAAKALAKKADATVAELDAATLNITTLTAAVKDAETDATFLVNLLSAIDTANNIIDSDTSEYTAASVKALKTKLTTARDSALALLNSLPTNADGSIDIDGAALQRAAIEQKAADIFAIVSGELVATLPILLILEEAATLDGAIIDSNYPDSRPAYNAAVKKLQGLLVTATSVAEVNQAIDELRAILDNLRLMVPIKSVDEAGNLLAQSAVRGIFKGHYTVVPEEIAGYEFVSSSTATTATPLSRAGAAASDGLSGTFGDGTNEITLVYKSVGLPPVPPIRHILPKDDDTDKIDNTDETKYIKLATTKRVKGKKLTQTNVSLGAMPAIGGLGAAMGSIVAYIKGRRNKK